jgi:opacity protein-like surface antigen
MPIQTVKVISITALGLLTGQLTAGDLGKDHISLDLTQLSRDSSANVTYVYNNGGTVNNPVDDIPVANTGSFDDDADVGFRLSGSKNLNQQWAIHAGLLSNELSKTDSSTDPAGELEIFRLPLTDNFDAAHSVQATYTSELQGIEVNAVYQFNDNVDFLVGVGYWTLDEKFNITSDDTLSAGVGTYNINTKNKMLGPQVGVAFNYKPAENLGLYMTGKIGWFSNDVDQNQTVDDSPAFTRSNSGSGNEDSTFYDVRVGLNYYFTKQLAVNLGYQMIDISNVALAESQFDTTATGSNTVNSSDDITWDGFNLGINYSF